MKQFFSFVKTKSFPLIFLQCLLVVSNLIGQQTTMSDYVLFGGSKTLIPGQKIPGYPGFSVQLGSNNTIQGGITGSYKVVKTNGTNFINGNIYTGRNVDLANNNTVTGKIAIENKNLPILKGNILLAGTGSNLIGDINVNGNVTVGGGIVSGKVTIPAGFTYSGPLPGGGNVVGNPALPTLPILPPIAAIPDLPGLTDVLTTQTIAPGLYSDLRLKGGQTVTFDGPGIYIFDQIQNSGVNNLVFDFKNNPSGTIKIYVVYDVTLDAVNATAINGGGASRIFTEVHGTANFCFRMNNGAPGAAPSRWLGTVWAPYSSINIGSTTGNCSIIGAVWSGSQVNIQSGATITYDPFSEDCGKPDINAGKDIALEFENNTSLTATSNTAGVTFNWKAINGGEIESPTNAASINVSSAGTYIVTATTETGCAANDTVNVTSKVNDLIGSELTKIFQKGTANSPNSPFFIFQNDSVYIDIITIQGQYAAALAKFTMPAFGLTKLISNGSSNFIITGLFPINKLPLLNLETSLIVYVRPYYKAYSNNGIVSSAGDTAMRSDLVREGYQLQGTGIKIGVISDSYNTILNGTTTPFKTNTAAQDVGNDDLPGSGNPAGNLTPVNVLLDYPVRGSDEGRAMLQIIHDVAPKAQLYFRTGFFSGGDFASGIEQLRLAGCSVIVDDVTFITEPFLKDGVVANAVDAAKAAGVTYFSAAGNFANKSYENNFNPLPAPGGLSGTAHSFNGTDVFQNVTLPPGDYTIVLQWLDDIYSLGQTAQGGTKNDLDIYLTPKTDGTALFGFNRNNTNGDPIEILPFTLTNTLNTNILIVNSTVGGIVGRFKYIVFRGNIAINEYNSGNSTIVGQANAEGAIAIGAARYDKVAPYPGPLLVESFSSIGGTFVGATARNKPDLVAPDGVNTTVKLGQDYPLSALDGYSNFFGTSAAAPHAAAVAALIMEGKNKFLNQPFTSPDEIKNVLQISATDMYTSGFDYTSGAGFINADSAMRTFANPDPTLISLIVPPGVTPGTVPFTLKVKGRNFSYSSVIKFRDIALPTIFINSEEATAIVPEFTGNPPISVYTPPKVLNGIDGGTSDTLYFFGIVKKNIVVKADNYIKKYAENMPVLTATVLVDGQPLAPPLTLADIGLDQLVLSTQATAQSDVGNYVILASRVFDAQNPVDAGLLETYNYTFNQGTLTIEKLPLKITPVDKTITYGDHVGDIDFNYVFDQSNVPNPSDVLTLIKTFHQGFLPNNALAVINDFKKVQSDGTILSEADLFNLSTMASLEALKNSRKFSLVNNKLVPLVDPNAFDIQYLLDVSSVSIFNYTKDPSTSIFINGFPGYSNKALLGANALSNNTGKVFSNGSLVQMVNGSLVQMVNGANGKLVPLFDGSLVQIVNGSLVQLVNGQYVPIPNGSLVQLVNGKLVQLVNGSLVQLVNGSLVQMVNGSLVQMVNGSLVQLVNGQQSLVIDGSLVQLVNGSLVQLVNGQLVPILDGSLVQLVNGSLVQMVNGSLVQLVNGSLVQLVNGSLVQLVNGSLVQIVNSSSVGVGNTNNNTAVIFDEADALPKWIGSMFGINMITGLDAGQQKLIPGFLANENFDISYGLGNINILPKGITVTPSPNQSKVYGNADPVFTYTTSALEPGASFTGKLDRVSGENVANSPYAFTLGNLSAGVNYLLTLNPTNTFAITKRPIIITPDAGQSKVYGDPDPVFTFTSSEPLLPGNVYTGKLGRRPIENVNDNPYPFNLGTLSAGDNYMLTLSGPVIFTITKAPLTVKADDKTIFSGDPLPKFTSTFTGLKLNDHLVVNYSLSPNCTGLPGVYTITPLLSQSRNYNTTYIKGKLYVNPKGEPAVAINLSLDCIEDINPSSPTRRYLAHFVATNSNSTPIYVAVGSSNRVSSSGSFDKSQQPVVFKVGTTRFDVPFDGALVKWDLKTYQANTLVTKTATASATSPICSTYTGVGGRAVNSLTINRNGLVNATNNEIVPQGNINVFPNPVRTKTTIYLSKDVINVKEALLFDVHGRGIQAKIIRQVSKNAIEIDMTGLATGMYFMRIKVEKGYKNVSILKE